jgi:trimeric autotransporter adhesin
MKNKLAKLMGVVLTAMTVVSLFAFAVPASAATITPQTWTKQALPGATGYVMPNNVVESGPIVQAADGTLYMYEQNTVTSLPNAFNILKSVPTGTPAVAGRTWSVTGTAGQPTETVTALVAYGTNLYYTTGTKLFRSTDGGLTFINIANTIGGNFTSMDVAAYSGRNIIILGTTNDVYFIDEADPFFNLNTVGTPDFSSIGGSVMAVKAAPSFGTDRAVAAISSNGNVSFDVMGGAWGGIIGTVAVSGTVSAASIHFATDWNSTTNPNFYFGVTAGSASGVYAFRGGINASSNLVQIYSISTSTSSTAAVSSLDVSGTYGAATIYVGFVNSASAGTQLAWTTNGGASWSTPTKLQSLTLGKKVYVLLDNNFAAATPNNTVYVLVGGTGLAANDQTGFYYSTDKGASFNQISLINNAISIVNDLAASSGTTFVSTSYNGTSPTSAIPVGSAVIKAGSFVNVGTNTTADSVTVTSGAAGTVIYGNNFGTPPAVVATPTTIWNPVTNVITFTAANQTATFTATTTNVTFVLTASAIGVIAGVTQPSGGTSTINGLGDPNWGISLNKITATGVNSTAAFDNLEVTLAGPPAAGAISVVFNPTTGGTYNPATGVIHFASIGQTATITNTLGSSVVITNATAAYTVGSSFDVLPTVSINGATAVSIPVGGSGTGPLTLGIAVAATTGTSSDSIWRWDGTNFERVFVSYKTLLPTSGTNGSWPANTVVGTATMVRVSSKYATDKTVFYAALGGIFLSYSTDAGQTWKTQSTGIGAGVASPGSTTAERIDSLLVVDGNTQFIGSSSSVSSEPSRIVKSTTNGVGNILYPAWSEVILKTLAASNLSGAVTDISVASNGDLVAVVTDPAATYVFKSTDNGVTWKGLVDPNGTTDATLGISAGGAFVDPAADYATTGNIFVTLNAGGVYRYSVLNTVSGAYGVAALGWLRVDGAVYDANGAVIAGTGEVVAAGGPGSTAEGSGMVYATDSSSATQGVSRIRGLSTQAEALPGTVVFTGLWASSALAGNVQLWTIDNTSTVKALWTYVDTLNVAGGAVVSTPTGVTTATVTFPALANATDYVVLVSASKINSLYGTTGALATSGTGITVTHAAGALTASVSGLASGATYYASVWATAPVSSFIFNGAPVSFTTPLDYPRTPTDNLVPLLGAANIPLSPNFAWNTVVGATSYTLQITAASDVAFASPIFNSATIPVVTGPSATFTYLGTLSTGTSYLWRVKANGTTGSDWVYGNFSTIAAVTPAVIVTQTSQPAPTIIITQPAAITITIPAAVAGPAITVTSPSYTLVNPPVETPTYIWIIVGVGALLTLAVIILIIRTRRVV